MSRVRHRCRLRLSRFIAWAGSAVAVALSGAAFVLGGRWLSAAAVVGALVSLLLGAVVLRIDHRWRIEFAKVRAAQAAGYATKHERYFAEHRSFTTHMVGLLDAASDRIGVQRNMLDLLKAEIAGLHTANSAGLEPSHDLALRGDTAEWIEPWPGVADAPTVVDLVEWDERTQPRRIPEPVEDVAERSA